MEGNPMTTTSPAEVASNPAHIRHIKEAEKRNLQTMLVLLGGEVAYVAIAAIVGLPVWAILPVAGAFVLVIGFFGYRTHKYTQFIKKIDAEIQKRMEFHRFLSSVR